MTRWTGLLRSGWTQSSLPLDPPPPELAFALDEPVDALVDPLSLLLAREANVVVEDGAFAAELRERLRHAMRHAGRRMDPRRHEMRPWRERLLDRVAYAIMRAALWVTGKRY